MLRQLWKRFKRLFTPVQKETTYTWKSIQTGMFAGLNLYLPVNWGEEIIQGQHEKEFFDIIKRMAGKGGIFYDIGGHYGWFTAAWLQCGGGYVEAFEPLAENRDVIKEMLSRNGWENRVRIHAAAIGRHTGNDWLIAYPGDTSRTFILQTEEIHTAPPDAVRQEVPIWTLSDFVREQKLGDPDLIKVDVEGLEGDVIEGASAFLSRSKAAIMIEIHSILNGLRTADQLGRLGYRMEIIGMKGKRKSLPLTLWTHPDKNNIHE